jgi:hypothetical protein
MRWVLPAFFFSLHHHSFNQVFIEGLSFDFLLANTSWTEDTLSP